MQDWKEYGYNKKFVVCIDQLCTLTVIAHSRAPNNALPTAYSPLWVRSTQIKLACQNVCAIYSNIKSSLSS
jgi:hypothetical protein